MFSAFWHTVFFDPIYNLLIFVLNHIPAGDVGIAIVVLSVLIKIILLPLSLRAAKTQHAMRALEPELASVKEKHKDDRERLARETMDVYKRAGVNPFAGIVIQLIQIPIMIALYLAVSRGGGVPFPDINTALLYSFVPAPETVSMLFLGFIDMTSRSLPLALAAALAQFFHTRLALPPLPAREKDAAPSFKDDFARSMQIQMRYMMPVIIFFVSYSISATIALYLLVSGLLSIAQEYVTRRHVVGR